MSLFFQDARIKIYAFYIIGKSFFMQEVVFALLADVMPAKVDNILK